MLKIDYILSQISIALENVVSLQNDLLWRTNELGKVDERTFTNIKQRLETAQKQLEKLTNSVKEEKE
jgi:uncharacterized lipoprotein YbaY